MNRRHFTKNIVITTLITGIVKTINSNEILPAIVFSDHDQTLPKLSIKNRRVVMEHYRKNHLSPYSKKECLKFSNYIKMIINTMYGNGTPCGTTHSVSVMQSHHASISEFYNMV